MFYTPARRADHAHPSAHKAKHTASLDPTRISMSNGPTIRDREPTTTSHPMLGLEQLHEPALGRDDRHGFPSELERPASPIRDEVSAAPPSDRLVHAEEPLEVRRDERACTTIWEARAGISSARLLTPWR